MRIGPLLFLAMVLTPGVVLTLPQSPATTATITGTVVSGDRDVRPIRRATVEAAIPGNRTLRWLTTTGDDGRFVLSGLPPGNVVLSATRPGYITSYYGAVRPGSTNALPLALVAGESVGPLRLALTRGVVITGRVIDEAGRPAPSIGLQVHRRVRHADGAIELVRAISRRLPSTDDLGRYRIHGLAPGSYVVSIRPPFRNLMAIMEGGTEVRVTTDEDVRWARAQIAGAPARTAAAEVREPAASNRPVTYATVYYPGTTDVSAAAEVRVDTGEERSDIDLQMQLVPTARISGTVVDSLGQPAAGLQMSLLPHGMSSGIEAALTMVSVGLMAPGAAPTRTAADGTFTMTAVAPGDYLLVARSAAGRGAAPVGSVRWAQTEVLVDGADIEGVRLTLLSGVTLAGRVMPAGPEALPAGMPLSVTLVPAGAQGVSVVSEPQVDPSGRFAIENVLPGRYRVRASLGSWGLEAAALGETDVADVLLEITDGVDRDGLALRFLPRLGSVSGTLYDGANRPSNDLFVLLFPVNRADWFEDSRRMRAPVRTASDGRFAFDDLPAGEYCLAALADFDNAEWHTLGFLEAVLPAATRIAVAAGQVTQQDVRVAGGG